MPSLPPVDFVARVVLNTNYAGEPCANVLHFRNTDSAPTYSMAALAEKVSQLYVANIINHNPETVELVSVTATDLDSTPVAAGSNTTGSGTSGGNATPQLPNNVTACLTLRTALGGRSGRGRLYHVGLTEGDVILNVLDPARVAQLITGYNFLLNFSASDGHGWHWTIVSYYHFNALRSTPVKSDVSTITCDSTVDSMRKRIPGH